MGEIINNPSASYFNEDSKVKNYLGTSYILKNKADFEPRKNI